MTNPFIVSEPRKQLVGEGKNAKYVNDCKEIYLGNMGIQKIRGFEDFINLEYLCLNGNKLKKINNLDGNFRVKVLSAQDNQICTLKGSLTSLRNLEQLDLSNNDLRDLAKLLPILERFQFLTHLNLKGNPCCEEPDYRLQVVHVMPGVKVLDQHVITVAERLKARANIGGDLAALTIAFGQRAPFRDMDRVHECSKLEMELAKEAERVREVKICREEDAELTMFSHNPHPDIPRGQSLPPNAGTRRAMEHLTSNYGAESTSTSRGLTQDWTGTVTSQFRKQQLRSDSAKSRSQPSNVFVLYSSQPRTTNLVTSGTSLTKPPPGNIGFDRKKYETFVTRKAAGTLGQWEMEKKTLRL